jgi:uncharacterized protein YecT (DUF1311 family)
MKAAMSFCLAILVSGSAFADIQADQQEANNFKAADQELNAAYKGLMLQLSSAKSDFVKVSDVKNSIILAQRQWLKLRDLDCAIDGQEVLWGGGNGISGSTNQCKTQMTKERTKRIGEMAQVFVSRPLSTPVEVVGVIYSQPNPNGRCGASTYGFIADGQSTTDASDAGRVDICVEGLGDNLKISSNLEVDPKLKGDARMMAILKKASKFQSLKMLIHVDEEQIDSIEAK